MAEHHPPRRDPADVDVDSLADGLEDIDAEEVAELDALGGAIAAAFAGAGPEIDAAGVDAIWDRIEPQS